MWASRLPLDQGLFLSRSLSALLTCYLQCLKEPIYVSNWKEKNGLLNCCTPKLKTSGPLTPGYGYLTSPITCPSIRIQLFPHIALILLYITTVFSIFFCPFFNDKRVYSAAGPSHARSHSVVVSVHQKHCLSRESEFEYSIFRVAQRSTFPKNFMPSTSEYDESTSASEILNAPAWFAYFLRPSGFSKLRRLWLNPNPLWFSPLNNFEE